MKNYSNPLWLTQGPVRWTYLDSKQDWKTFRIWSAVFIRLSRSSSWSFRTCSRIFCASCLEFISCSRPSNSAALFKLFWTKWDKEGWEVKLHVAYDLIVFRLIPMVVERWNRRGSFCSSLLWLVHWLLPFRLGAFGRSVLNMTFRTTQTKLWSWSQESSHKIIIWYPFRTRALSNLSSEIR